MVKKSTNINTTNNYLSFQVIEYKENTMTYGTGNLDPDLGQAQKCGRDKPVNMMLFSW